MFDYTNDNGQRDLDGKKVSPHPDGKAWVKCCRDQEIDNYKVDCAFVRTQEHGPRLSKDRRKKYYGGVDGLSQQKIGDVPFFCVHRTDDGHHRVCAGWDACFGNKAIASAAGRPR